MIPPYWPHVPECAHARGNSSAVAIDPNGPRCHHCATIHVQGRLSQVCAAQTPWSSSSSSGLMDCLSNFFHATQGTNQNRLPSWLASHAQTSPFPPVPTHPPVDLHLLPTPFGRVQYSDTFVQLEARDAVDVLPLSPAYNTDLKPYFAACALRGIHGEPGGIERERECFFFFFFWFVFLCLPFQVFAYTGAVDESVLSCSVPYRVILLIPVIVTHPPTHPFGANSASSKAALLRPA